MKLYVRMELLQFCAVVLNALFLTLAVSLAGFGAWILLDETNFLNAVSSEELRLVAVGLLLIGALVLLASVVGFVGASRSSRFLLLVYLGFIIVLVLLQLFITLLLLFGEGKIRRSLDQTVDHVIVHYGNGSHSNDRLMDDLQRSGACCGMTGPSDWLKNWYVRTVNLTGPDVLPCSCFESSRRHPDSPWCVRRLNATERHVGQGTDLQEDGCDKKKLSDWLWQNERTFISMDISILLIQGLQFTIIVYLYRAVGQKGASSALVDHADVGHAPDDHLDYGELNAAYVEPEGNYLDHHLYPPEDQNHYQPLRYPAAPQ